MKGTAKSKAVTSGRLTGRVKEQVARRRVQSPGAGPAACPKPAYSLYSTDSEDQVSCLHHGLDRCAALLNDILQADKPGCLRSVTAAASSKSRPCSSPAKKTTKATKASKTGFSRQSLRTQTSTVPTSCPPPDKRSCRSVRQGPGRSNFQRAGSAVPLPQTSIPPSQTSILPPQTSIPSQQTCIPPPQTSIPPSQTSTPPPQTSTRPSDQLSVPHTDLRSASNSPPTSCKAECDGEEDEDFVPVRDTDTGSTAGGHLKVSGMRPGVPEDGDASEDVKLRTVQYLLGELKALIAGRGSVAEKLLSHLEQTVTNVAGSNPSSIHSQNPQLRRCVRTPLKDRGTAERQQNLESLSNLEVSSLQEDLGTAQVRLQDLQEDLAGLRQALQDTRSQLTDREAENARLRTDLEATKSRLLDREQEQSRLASVAQQRLEEIGNLNRLLHCSSRRPQDVASSGSTTPVPAESPAERIGHFLSTLGSTQGGQEVTSAQLGDASPQHCGWQHTRPSLCGSVCSDWSVRSGSTFDTRDEAAFREGLAALDASIASLQKTLQQDLK